MIRRNARLRNEFLYRKSLEGKQSEEYEKKRAIRQALQEGKPIPTELRAEASNLQKLVDLDDDNTAVQRTHVDDEYASLGVEDPKVMVTTSRDPSSRLVQFAKEIKLLLPGSIRVNRGAMIIKDLVDSCRSHAFTDIVLLHENRGQPDAMVVCHMPYGPTAYFGIYNCVTRHDIGTKAQIGTISEVFPNCIFDNFTTKLGKRFETILKALFPVPKPSSKRLVTFANKNDYISMRHHMYAMNAGPKSLQLTEVGPRFELRPYQIRLGTLEQSHADDEWVMRAYVRSSKRMRLAEEKEDDDDDVTV